jgi:hypothetical protein
MKKNYSFNALLILLIAAIHVSAQNPVSLRNDVTVQFVMNVKEKAARIAKDPVSNNYFYITSVGNVYQIKNILNNPYDTLMYTTNTHSIDFLQGMAFIDSSLFLIGNKIVDSIAYIGMIKKAVAHPSGPRTWVNVVTTATYAQSYTWYDHGWSGIVASPDKQFLYTSSGSRTDHGEEQNNYGLYPGMREVPLTSAIFRFPANSVNLSVPNTNAGIAPYLWADGTRNSFDLAFDSNNNLFATENSGDRDDPDELNWIRQGRHYGFPWNLGGDANPQQFGGYNPATDKLLNHSCNCYIKNYYYNDPAFPPQGTVVCTPAVKNIGPDADKYRMPNGNVNDGSDSGNNIYSFTPHRCALGLNFDRNNILIPDLKGGAFAVSFTRGGDSTGLDQYNYPGTICDPGQDLMHLKLSPDGSEYKMQATTIVKQFNYPVDTYMDQNILYVIEYSYSGPGRLFKITLPLDIIGIKENSENSFGAVYPNPSSGIVNLDLSSGINSVSVKNLLGENILSISNEDRIEKLSIDLSSQPKGIYFLEMKGEEKSVVKKIILE